MASFNLSSLAHRSVSFESSSLTEFSPGLPPTRPLFHPTFFELSASATERSAITAERLPTRDEIVASIKLQILDLAQKTNELVSQTQIWTAQPSFQGSPTQVKALSNAFAIQLHMQSIVTKIERVDAHFALKPASPLEGTIRDDFELLARARVVNAIGNLQFHEVALTLAVDSSADEVQKWLRLKKSAVYLLLCYQVEISPTFDAALRRKMELVRVIEGIKEILESERFNLPESAYSWTVAALERAEERYTPLMLRLNEEHQACLQRLKLAV